jgi:hypothetical protein
VKSAPQSHLYDQFDEFVRRLRRERSDLADIEPSSTIRVLCLPDEYGATGWDEAAGLSQALSGRAAGAGVNSALVAELSEAVARAGLTPAGPGTPATSAIQRVVIVPSSIDGCESAWSTHRARAGDIKDALHGLDPAQVAAAVAALI